LTRPWFSKGWGIQEFVLASKPMFCYGRHMVSKEAFYHTALILTFKNVDLEISSY
jgi:hypothetical protein